MATVYVLEGATDLSAGASYSGGALPSDNDTLEFRSGSQTISAGLTALQTISLGAVNVYPQFTGAIGTAGSSLVLQVDGTGTNIVSLNGSGAYIYVAAYSTGGIPTLVAKPNGGAIRLTGGTTATVKVYGGSFYLDSGAVATTVYNSGGVVLADANGTAITTLYNDSGEFTCWRSITTGYVNAPLVLDRTAAITTAHVHGDGMLNHKSTGTATTVNLYGRGGYTPAGALTAPTVTTLNIHSRNARYFKTAGLITVTPGTTNNNVGATERTQESVSPFGD